MFHLLNRELQEAELTLDSALAYQDIKTSATAWLRKGEIAYRLSKNPIKYTNIIVKISEAISCFERVKMLSKIGDEHYRQAETYLLKVWELSLKEAMQYYDRGEHQSARKFCNLSKQILPEELTSYLLLGHIAHRLKDYPLMMQNYAKLIHSGYYREEVLSRMLAYKLEQADFIGFIKLTDVAAEAFPEKNNYFLKEKIIRLQSKNQWKLATTELQKLEKHYFELFDFSYLKGVNDINSGLLKTAYKQCKKLAPSTDAQKMLVAELLLILAKKIITQQSDKDGNASLSKKSKKLLARARQYLEAVKITDENMPHVRNKLKIIGAYLGQ